MPGSIPQNPVSSAYSSIQSSAVPQTRTTTVRQGDTLSSIANRNYDLHSPNESARAAVFIARYNGVEDADVIQPGQTLQLPAEQELLEGMSHVRLQSPVQPRQMDPETAQCADTPSDERSTACQGKINDYYWPRPGVSISGEGW